MQGLSAVPGAAGTRVAGSFGASRGSGAIGPGQTLSVTRWGLTLGQTGRFAKDWSSNSSSIGIGEGAVSVQSGSNNGESYAGAMGAGVVVGSIQKKNPNGDREGTYAINGYAITLRYDNGRVERLPFFFDSAKQSRVWFEGGLMAKGG